MFSCRDKKNITWSYGLIIAEADDILIFFFLVGGGGGGGGVGGVEFQKK